MKQKILFIIPPSNLGYGYINKFFWQKGLLHIATYLHNNIGKKYDVSICDGNIRSIDNCLKDLASNIYYAIGVYCLDHTKDNGILIINRAIDIGIPKIILGGPGIINSCESYSSLIVNKASRILYCKGQGEVDILNFILDKNNNPDIIFSRESDWDMSLYDSNENNLYFEAYRDDLINYALNQLNDLSYPYNPITYSTLSHVGCWYRCKNGGCEFCGIPHHFFHKLNSSAFWQDFCNFRDFIKSIPQFNNYSVNSIKDWGDSINTEILENLLSNRPEYCSNVSYSCYLSCKDITKENMELLKKLNCFSVYIGVDGTSNESLSSLRKGYNITSLRKELALLNEYNFKVEIGLIIGNKGETKKSLEKIVEFAKELVDMFTDKIIVIQGNVLIPMPGSKLYNNLNTILKYSSNSINPLLHMSVQDRISEWLRLNTSVTFDDCVNIQHQIEQISPRKHSYVLDSSIV